MRAPVSSGARLGGVEYVALRFAGQCDLGERRRDAVHVVHGSGRASRLRVPAGWLSLLVPLSGSLQLQSQDEYWALEAGELQSWRDAALRVDCPSSGAWLALAAAPEAWRRHLGAGAVQDPAAEVFARTSRCPRGLRRLLVRLARTARGGTGSDPGMLLEAAWVAVLEQQADLQPCLQRCSGRTLARRRKTLQRLLRVQHLIRTHGNNRAEVGWLARSVGYSPWHMIRCYRDVFGETPSEYAARLRLARAWEMVRGTRMPISEVAEALGFESESSFCRAFKQAYGATTGEVRNRGVDSARAADEPIGLLSGTSFR
jgi:AraC-like DNA-binding protein